MHTRERTTERIHTQPCLRAPARAQAHHRLPGRVSTYGRRGTCRALAFSRRFSLLQNVRYFPGRSRNAWPFHERRAAGQGPRGNRTLRLKPRPELSRRCASVATRKATSHNEFPKAPEAGKLERQRLHWNSMGKLEGAGKRVAVVATRGERMHQVTTSECGHGGPVSNRNQNYATPTPISWHKAALPSSL